jgi:hypothetical protein
VEVVVVDVVVVDVVGNDVDDVVTSVLSASNVVVIEVVGAGAGVSVEGGDSLPFGSTEGTTDRRVVRRSSTYAVLPASFSVPVESTNHFCPVEAVCQSAINTPERIVESRRIRSLAV